MSQLGMQPLVAGSLWTSWPLISSTTTEDAPQLQLSARLAGAAAAATVKTSARQARTSKKPRFIWLQRHMA